MRLHLLPAACAAIAASAVVVGAQTLEERAVARDVLSKHADAIVTARATMTLRGMPGPGGRAGGMEDVVQAPAIVLDGTGLTVAALSVLDPSEVFKHAMGQVPGASAMNISAEHSNIRLRLGTGQEVPARIVLRDRDLDLAFLRPAVAPASPMPSVDMTTAAKVLTADLVLLVHRFGEMTGWKPGVSFGFVQTVVDKPRTLYVVAAPMAGGGGLGSAVFDTAGRFLGLMVMRRQSSGRSSLLSMMQGTEGLGMIPVVLPAEEIAELAKQAK